MPLRVSEQTPLLREDRSASGGLFFTKTREYSLLALDGIIFTAFYPTKLNVDWLARKLDPWGRSPVLDVYTLYKYP